MPLPSRRRMLTLATASALSTLVVGITAPLATAASAAPASAASAEATSWFHDPRTPAQRRAEVAVPAHPEQVGGAARETRQVYRTAAGSLAVPISWAAGHALTRGQAVTLGGANVFAVAKTTLSAKSRTQLVSLSTSLSDATSIRCEGYTDHHGDVSANNQLAKARAAEVCKNLKSRDPKLVVKVVGYGPHRPAVVGGDVKDRGLNRRVVIVMTGAVQAPPVTPVGPRYTVPSAPVLLGATGGTGQITYQFTPPTSDGGRPISGYQVWNGQTWVPVTNNAARVAQSPRASMMPAGTVFAYLPGVPGGTTVALKVRAVNSVGAGAPSNSVSATSLAALAALAAPTNVQASVVQQEVTLSFDPPVAVNGSALQGFQVSDNGGSWNSVTYGFQGGHTVTVLTNVALGTHQYSIRAVDGNGAGAASAPVNGDVTEATTLGAPQNLQATVFADQVTLSFDAPLFNGLMVSGYQVSIDDGAWMPVSTAYAGGHLTVLVDVVSPGTHTFSVRGVGPVDPGDATDPVSAEVVTS